MALRRALAFAGLLGVKAILAQESEAPPEGAPAENRADIHFQMTTVTQAHRSFDSPYSARNSLQADPEHETTVTATLFLGARLWKGAELYVNPELSGGSGLSHTLGVAGFPNGEAFRVGDAQPHIYLARAFLRQTFAVGPKTEAVEEEANQLGGSRPVRRWTLTAGRFALGDIFDENEYSHDPRGRFLNWAAWTAGAWDYAADIRGYTWGVAVEYETEVWAARFGAAAEPEVANANQFDTDLRHAYALSTEFERRYDFNGRKGSGKAILFYNRANMGNYRQAIDTAPAGSAPDVTLTRQPGRTKWGFVLNVEQELGEASGLFLRASWNDGRNESWAYAEIDRSVAIGTAWRRPLAFRPADEAGFAIILSALSHDHRDYLAAGGYGFMLGDGKLTYGLETIGEIYYKAALRSFLWLTGDLQFVQNPGYNEDRGPVPLLGLRLHAEF